MYSWQSSLQPQQRYYDSSSPHPVASHEQEGVGGEDASRWGRWEHESRIPLGGYIKPPEWSACGNNPSQLPGGTWERGVGLIEDEEEERKRRRWEQPQSSAVRTGTSHPVPPSIESFPPLQLDEPVKGVYCGPEPPPSRLCVYLYRISIPFPLLGGALIGPSGSTQVRILITARLVRFSLEPERLRFADFLGSKNAIKRALSLIRDEAEQSCSYSSSRFAVFDERNLVRVSGMWLEERFAEPRRRDRRQPAMYTRQSGDGWVDDTLSTRPSQFEEDNVEADWEDPAELEEPRSSKRRRRCKEEGDKGTRRAMTKRQEEQEVVQNQAQSLAVAFPIPTTSAIRFLHPSSALAYIEDNTGSALTLVSQGNTSRLGIVAPDAEALEDAIVLVERVVGIDEKGWRVPRAGGGGEGEKESKMGGENEEMADFEQEMSENGGRGELTDEKKLRSLALSSRTAYRNSRQSPSPSVASSADPSPTHFDDSPSLHPFSPHRCDYQSRSTIVTTSDRSVTPSSPRLSSAVQHEDDSRPRQRWSKAFDAEERYERAWDSGRW